MFAAAIVELSARIQHRTSVLGSMIQGVGVTTQGLQEGCIALETHVAQLASAVQEQQRFMEQLREQSADSSETARVQLDQLRQEVTATLEQQGQGMQGNRRDLDQTIQRTAAIEARVETLAGQLEEIASMSRTMLVVQQEHKTRLDTQGQVLYSPITGGNAEELTLVVQRLANKVDSELEFLRSEAATASDTHRETRANIMNLDNTMGVVSERLATVEKYVEDRELTSGDATSSGPQIFEMTPGKSPSFGGSSPLTAWWHEGENDAEAHRSEWSSKRAEDDHPWGLSVPPPGLPSEFTNKDTSADTAAAPPGEESPQTAKGKFAVPNAKWQTLQDIPSFNPKDGAGSPWELALRLDVWKRQVLTLAATVQPLFAEYVAECFKRAQARHDRQAAGESLTALVPVTGFPAEYESRLVMVLLRTLPDSVKTPALEADEGHRDIASLRLLEELYLCVRPGGLEEQQALVRFLRNVSPAASARDAIDMLRRWRLAKSRVASLSLPEIPAYEQIKGIQAMIKTLEKSTTA